MGAAVGLDGTARRLLAGFGQDDVGGRGRRARGGLDRVRRRRGVRLLFARDPPGLHAQAATDRTRTPFGDRPPGKITDFSRNRRSCITIHVVHSLSLARFHVASEHLWLRFVQPVTPFVRHDLLLLVVFFDANRRGRLVAWHDENERKSVNFG